MRVDRLLISFGRKKVQFQGEHTAGEMREGQKKKEKGGGKEKRECGKQKGKEVLMNVSNPPPCYPWPIPVLVVRQQV